MVGRKGQPLGDSGAARFGDAAKQALPHVFGAAALALDGDHDEAGQLINDLADDPSEAAMIMFGAVLGAITRSAALLEIDAVEHARDLAMFYWLGTRGMDP